MLRLIRLALLKPMLQQLGASENWWNIILQAGKPSEDWKTGATHGRKYWNKSGSTKQDFISYFFSSRIKI